MMNYSPLEIERDLSAELGILLNNLPCCSQNPEGEQLLEFGLFLPWIAAFPEQELAPDWRKIQAALISRNLQLADALSEFSSELTSKGLRHATIKGQCFAMRHYGDSRLRQSVDIDIITSISELEAVVHQAQLLGYEQIQPLQGFAKSIDLWGQHAVTLKHKKLHFELDIHWSLAQKQYALPDYNNKLWSRLEKVSLGNHSVPAVAPIDNLVSLCVGGFKDQWSKPRVFLDLKRCLPAIPPEEIAEEIKRFKTHGCQNVLLAPLMFLQSCFEETSNLRIEESTNLKKCIQILVDSTGQTLGENELFAIHLEFRDSWKSKARYLLGRLFIPHGQDWNSRLPVVIVCIYKPLKTLMRGLIGLRSKSLNTMKN